MFRTVQIQTIDGCNLKCKFCPRSYLSQTMKLMEEGLYRKIINELALLEFEGRVSPYLMNESLLDWRLVGFIEYTRKQLPKSIILISTNGVLATKELINDLIVAGMDRLLFSCYTKEIYDKAVELEKHFRGKIEPMPFYKENIEQTFYNRGGNIKVGEDKLVKKKCPEPFIQMFIDYSGKAILCCSDYKKEVVMGDVNNEKLIDIWNGEKYKHYRENLDRGEREKLLLCNKCNYGR